MISYYLFGMSIYFADSLVVVVDDDGADESKWVLAFTLQIVWERESKKRDIFVINFIHHHFFVVSLDV